MITNIRIHISINHVMFIDGTFGVVNFIPDSMDLVECSDAQVRLFVFSQKFMEVNKRLVCKHSVFFNLLFVEVFCDVIEYFNKVVIPNTDLIESEYSRPPLGG